MEEYNKKIFAENLNYYMSINNKTPADLIKLLNVSKSTVSSWRNGEKTPRMDKIEILAKYFNCLKSDLIEEKKDKRFAKLSIHGIMPLPNTVKRPRVGAIACGKPILAQENIEVYDDVPDSIKCDFTLICKGDSMINARLNDGDIVYIRQQETVENGEIAACLIEGEFETEATLKRVFKYDEKLILQSENPKYQPFVFVMEEMNKVKIIGKAVGFTSKI